MFTYYGDNMSSGATYPKRRGQYYKPHERVQWTIAVVMLFHCYSTSGAHRTCKNTTPDIADMKRYDVVVLLSVNKQGRHREGSSLWWYWAISVWKGLVFFFCPMLHMTQVKASPDKTPHAQPSQYALTHTNKDRWCACNCQWEVCRLLPQRGDERSRYCQRRGKMTRHLLVLPRPSIRPRKPVCNLNTNYTHTHSHTVSSDNLKEGLSADWSMLCSTLSQYKLEVIVKCSLHMVTRLLSCFKFFGSQLEKKDQFYQIIKDEATSYLSTDTCIKTKIERCKPYWAQ